MHQEVILGTLTLPCVRVGVRGQCAAASRRRSWLICTRYRESFWSRRCIHQSRTSSEWRQLPWSVAPHRSPSSTQRHSLARPCRPL